MRTLLTGEIYDCLACCLYRVYSFLALVATVKAPCNARMKHSDIIVTLYPHKGKYMMTFVTTIIYTCIDRTVVVWVMISHNGYDSWCV